MMDLKKLRILFPEINMTENASMAEECSFRAGGRAGAFIKIRDTEELKGVLRFMTEEKIPHIILGNGSNTLFSDGDHEIVVIKLDEESGFFNYMKIDEEDNDIREYGASMLLSVASKMAAEDEYSGMEGLSGIPGSVGGAVFMNAGAYGYEIKDIIYSAHAVSPDGAEERDFTPEEMVGKKVIVVANLKPRALRGMESKGMLLFADNGERVEIVTTDAEDGNSVN